MTEPAGVALNGAARLVPGPDGRTRVGVTFACGGLQATIVVEPDDADRFIDSVAAAVKQTSAQARRANLGLIVAGGNGHPGPTAALLAPPSGEPAANP